MKAQDLKANIRTATGNGPSRVLRSQGFIPAVLYGPGVDSMPLTVSRKALSDIISQAGARQVMVNLEIEDSGASKPRTAMIKELQSDPLSQQYLHADFYEVDMDRKIIVKIPVKTIGTSVGVELGGLLQIVRRTLEVICLPMDIPDVIEIDITDLDVGDSVHLNEIQIPDEFQFPGSVNFTVLTVVAPVTVEEEVEEEAEELEEGAEAEKDAEGEEKAEQKPAEPAK